MKVIAKTNAATVWPRRFRCTECNSLLELELSDIKRNADYTGDFTSWYIDCLACGEQPDVPKEWWASITRLKRLATNCPKDN